MKKIYFLLFVIFNFNNLHSQDLYFPPTTGNDWETIDPIELNWCDEKINSLYNFLEEKNTRAFLILKDGKIVLEKYLNGHGPDSLWYWASAGKTVTAALTGIAQEEGLLNINDPTSDYLGDGWTSAPQDKEDLITIRHQLTMTSGLDDSGFFECTDPECLFYLQDAGSRWAYHNGPYTNLSYIIEAASGQNYNGYYFNKLSQKTGMGGLWIKLGFNRLLFTKARSMARFGLLVQNDGYWDNTPILTDLDYINAMRNTSQEINKSYGYLWWLNGKESFKLPGLQFEFQGTLSENAPADAYSGIGKNGQFLSVVPSQGLVVVRMGEAPDDAFVPIAFFDEMWGYINDLACEPNSVFENEKTEIKIFPNPAKYFLEIEIPNGINNYEVKIFNSIGGQVVFEKNKNNINISKLINGVYFLKIKTAYNELIEKFTIIK